MRKRKIAARVFAARAGRRRSRLPGVHLQETQRKEQAG